MGPEATIDAAQSNSIPACPAITFFSKTKVSYRDVHWKVLLSVVGPARVPIEMTEEFQNNCADQRKDLELEGATCADAHLSGDSQQPPADCFGLSFTLLCAGKSRRRSAADRHERNAASPVEME